MSLRFHFEPKPAPLDSINRNSQRILKKTNKKSYRIVNLIPIAYWFDCIYGKIPVGVIKLAWIADRIRSNDVKQVED